MAKIQIYLCKNREKKKKKKEKRNKNWSASEHAVSFAIEW